MFEVIWRPRAADRIVLVAEEADDPEVVVAAVQHLDARLQTDPIGLGESRFGPIRVAFADPLGVLYEVVLDDNRVVIGDVWRVRTRG